MQLSANYLLQSCGKGTQKKTMLLLKLSHTVQFCGKSTEKTHAFVEKAWKKSLLFPCFLYKIIYYNLPCFCGKSMEYFRKNHGYWLSWKNHGICGNPWIFFHKFSMDDSPPGINSIYHCLC